MVSPLITHLNNAFLFLRAVEHFLEFRQIRARRFVQVDELSCGDALLGVTKISLGISGLQSDELDRTVLEYLGQGNRRDFVEDVSFGRIVLVRAAKAD